MEEKIDLNALADGNLHLIAFCSGKFAYIVEDPNGSKLAIYDTLHTKFPILVLSMLKECSPVIIRD